MGSYCDCLQGQKRFFPEAQKRDIDRNIERSKVALQKQVTKKMLAEWVRTYQKSIENANDIDTLLGSSSANIGGVCTPAVIDERIKRFASTDQGCDPVQYDIFRNIVSATGVKNFTDMVTQTQERRLKKVNGVYQCLSAPELNMLSISIGQNQNQLSRGIAGHLNGGHRDRAKLRINLVSNQLSSLENEAEFLRDPTGYDVTRHAVNDSELRRAIEALPLASGLVKIYTRQEIFDSVTKKMRPLTREEKLSNLRGLRELFNSVVAFNRQIGQFPAIEPGPAAKAKELQLKEVILDAYGKFNDKFRPVLSSITKQQNSGTQKFEEVSESICEDMVNDLHQISCAAPPLSNPAFAARVLGDGRLEAPLLSTNQCAAARSAPEADKAGGQLSTCLATDMAACSMSENQGYFTSLRSLNNYDNLEMWGNDQSTEAKEDDQYLMNKYCKDYTDWLDSPSSPCKGLDPSSDQFHVCVKGPGSRKAFAKNSSGNAIANWEMALENAYVRHGNSVIVGMTEPNQAGIETKINSTVARRSDLQDFISNLGGGSSTTNSSEIVSSTFMSDLGQAARDLMPMVSAPVAGGTVAPQVTLPFAVAAQSLQRSVQKKDEEIQVKEEELVQRQTQIQSPTISPSEKSALSAQIAALEADLKRLREDREDLEKQQRIAAAEAEVQNSGNASRAPASTRTTRSSNTKNDGPDVQTTSFSTGGGSSGGSGGGTGGAQASQAAASANFGTGASFGGKLGASSGAGLGSLSTAVRENLTLTVGGQPLSSANVVSLEVASTKDPAVIEQAISAQKDKLKFNAEGWATVEVYDQATKTAVYYQVRLNDSKLVLQMISKDEQQGIQKQVREWTASYQNLLKRLQRAPAQVSN